MMIPHGATINCSLWVHLQLNWAWSFLHVVQYVLQQEWIDLGHWNQNILWHCHCQPAWRHLTLQQEVHHVGEQVVHDGSAPSVESEPDHSHYDRPLNSFMVGKGTGLPSRNHWKWAVNNCANLIKVGMGRAKLVMIICQGTLQLGSPQHGWPTVAL